ncbi:RIB43A-like with coiled-coils protein 2 [Dysidea avara]|uniref:RIB43A-like with coiled-coils protein 2 n=1 Tax=Dysidea avara TaxID=196820 RepID=UPI00331D8203
MYKTDLAVDPTESAAIERRRIMEKQRQSRIFNARQRIIGVDVDALSHQVKERNLLNGLESQRNDAFAQEMVRHDQIGEILDQRQQKDVKQLNQELVKYRGEYQRVEDRKEFDLNDPDYKKKDKPARVSDADQRCSLSGAQLFQGEDLSFEQRKQLQEEQMREWTSQQIGEKQRLLDEQRKADQLYDMKAIELDKRASELAAAEEQTRRNLNVSAKQQNLKMVEEQKASDQLQRTQELDDNYTEMANNIHGNMLTENPSCATSAFGNHRVIPDRWKGMSPAQVEEVRRTQQFQRDEKQQMISEQQRTEADWDQRRVAEARAGLVLENQLNRQKKLAAKNLVEQNKRLAAEQKVKIHQLNKEVYTNQPTDQYFMQFNTSSR